MNFPIRLKTTTMAFYGGNPCKPYKWVLEQEEGERIPTLVCYQPFDGNGNAPRTWGKVGSWYLSTLALYPHTNSLYLDMGRDWRVIGMRAVIREALNTISPVDTKSIKLNLGHTKMSVFDVEDSAMCHIAADHNYYEFKYSAETVLSLIDKIKELEALRLKCVKEHEE